MVMKSSAIKPLAFRTVFKLDAEELKEFYNLRPLQGIAFSFWHKVAKKRNLDYTTILTLNGEYTALPIGHNKHWCYPVPLKCKVSPSEVKI